MWATIRFVLLSRSHTLTKRIAIACLLGLLLLVGCGQYETPSVQDVKDNAEYFTMTRPDGTEMACVQYGAKSNVIQDSHSWFSFTCDWSGTYKITK